MSVYKFTKKKGDKYMHSYHSNKSVFHYNSDFSGEIIIVNKETDEQISINGKDFINFSKYAIADIINMFVYDLFKVVK